MLTTKATVSQLSFSLILFLFSSVSQPNQPSPFSLAMSLNEAIKLLYFISEKNSFNNPWKCLVRALKFSSFKQR